MIIVTGGAGLIGSNIVASLNSRGISDILVVDHLKDGRKMRNLADLDIQDYLDRDDFLQHLLSGSTFGNVDTVFHLGACSSTTEWDGKFMMRNNFEYGKVLFNWCQQQHAQFLYASSASVYGLGENGFREVRSCEKPINMYAYSKFLFDQYVRSHLSKAQTQVVGFRYFNVYGPREAHKGPMASTSYHFNNQILINAEARLFEGTDGYANGEQRRDFVYVKDCVNVNMWFMDHPAKSGIFNVGTGRAQTFNDVAHAVLSWHRKHGQQARINYIPFPEQLRGAYQSYTQADISALRLAGYTLEFHTVEQGVSDYLDWLNSEHSTQSIK